MAKRKRHGRYARPSSLPAPLSGMDQCGTLRGGIGRLDFRDGSIPEYLQTRRNGKAWGVAAQVPSYDGVPANEILKMLPIKSWPYPRILLGVLLERSISHASLVVPWLMGIAQQGVPFIKINYGRTDVVRNKMAMHLLESPFTHLLMLDIDHVHPIDIVQRLARWVLLDPGRKVVGGLNFRRGEPYDPCCFYLASDGKFHAPAEWTPGLINVDAIGTGSILISREVFEQIEPPWFYNDYSHVWADEWPGEDMGFSAKCREAGIEMWVDTTTTSPHITDGLVDEASFREYIADHGMTIVPTDDDLQRKAERKAKLGAALAMVREKIEAVKDGCAM